MSDPSSVSHVAAIWNLRPGVTYLNHGSFGPSPQVVIDERRRLYELLESEPMDFLSRQLATALDEALAPVARFVGTSVDKLVWVDNATVAMNVVAASVKLAPGDEVLLNDHEYGAVRRIWELACQRAGARVITANIGAPLRDPGDVVDVLAAAMTERTRLVVVSHVTSATAVVFPIEAICQMARQRGVAVCVDGPHALVQQPLDVDALDCDFYMASCHKWLSAPFGTGFLYVHPRCQANVRPAVVSWGGWPDTTGHWRQEFAWSGTRDPSGFLAVPAALAFLESYGIDRFRRQTHALAQEAYHRVTELTGHAPLTTDSAAWYGPMVALPLGTGDARALQLALWQRYQIEPLVVSWSGRRLLRLSFYLYNSSADIDRLLDALGELQSEFALF